MPRARIQDKLKLTDEDVGVIKQLLTREGFNDQKVLAIFSQLGRTVNHREIGFIRTGHIKYAAKDVAKPDASNAYLVNYLTAINALKKRGMLPTEEFFQHVIKAHEAMISAITVFNNPNISFRAEIFITNAVIAWTYLCHAHFISQNIDHCYQGVTTKHGGKKYWDLSSCLAHASCPLDEGTKRNLNYLVELRHEIEHRLAPNIDAAVSSKIQACAINFDHHIGKLFGNQYRLSSLLPFSIQLSQLSLDQRTMLRGKQGLPEIIETVNRAFEGQLTEDQLNDPAYSYKVYIIPKVTNRQNSADEALEFLDPKSEKGKELAVVLKQVEKAKFRPSQIVKQMRAEGFRWFRMHEFTQYWKKIDGKKPNKGLGVEVAGSWYWYESMIDAVRVYCAKENSGR